MLAPSPVSSGSDRQAQQGVLPAELEFYQSYDWCLNPYLTANEASRYLQGELTKLAIMPNGWQQSEVTTNIYLLSCGLLNCVDEYLRGTALRLPARLGETPVGRGAARIVETLSDNPWSRRLVRRWREHWLGNLNEFISGMLRSGAGDPACVAEAGRKLLMILESPLPLDLRGELLGTPTAFDRLDLTQRDFITLGESFVRRFPNRTQSILVVGLRTSGSYLAPLLKAFLEAEGYKSVELLTISPNNGVSRREKAELERFAAGGYLALIVDDPPHTSRSILAEHGHDVHLIGHGACPDIGSGRFHSLGPAPTRLAHWTWVIAGYAPAILSPRLSRFTAPLRPLHRRCRALLRQIRPDVIHANDWPVLPVATMMKKETGARIVYDSHEFAREEHGARWLWRLLYRPHVCATEAAGLRNADRVMTIGPGIAKLMARAYSLPRPPLVIANVPEYRPIAPHPVGPRLELLYHGLMTEGRGLETLIMAAARMQRHLRLVLRGDGMPRYVDSLRRLVASCAMPERVRFEPAVPIEEAIEAASHSDIGLFTPLLLTPQARFMLPNKLFEYLMAGLMVIVSDADDMAEIVRRYDCGLVLSDVSPSTLAATLDALEPDEIRRCKAQARQSARSLCWERERDKLIGLYAELAEAVRT